MEIKNTPPEDEKQEHLPEHVPGRRKLSRSVNDKIFLGLCGGVGERFKVEPTLIRILFILSILIGGWGIVIYLFAGIAIPKSNESNSASVKERILLQSVNNKILLGGILMLVGFFFTFNIYGIIQYFTFIGIPPSIFWSLVLIGSGLFIYTKPSTSSPLNKHNKLLREQSNKRIAGVCGGLAAYLNIDSNMCRMLWIIFSFVTLGVGLVLYFVLWLMVPSEDLIHE